MKCPNCNSQFKKNDITEIDRGAFSSKIKCPECMVWLEGDKKSAITQTVGAVIMFIAGMLLEVMGSFFLMVWISIGLVGLVVLILGFVNSNLEVCEEVSE